MFGAKRFLITIGIGLWGGLFFLPLIIAGLVTILPSLGYEPVLLETSVSLKYWRSFLSTPLFQKSIMTTLLIGATSAGAALMGAFMLAALLYPYTRHFIKWLAVMLALPHAAFALGISYLLAPSGFFVRLVEGITTWEGISGANNPFLFLDHWGVSLWLVLVVKEIPFLTFIILGSVRNYEVERYLVALKGLGYGNFSAWRRVLAPLVYKRMRLAFFIVIAYSLSVVDMAIIIGPQQPPTLSVLLVQFYNSGDLEMRFLAYAGAVFLGMLIGGSILLVVLIEKMLAWKKWWGLAKGKRWTFLDRCFQGGAWLTFAGLLFFTTISILVNMIWSVTEKWRYPGIFPTSYTLKYWKRALIPSWEGDAPSLTNFDITAFAGLFNKETFTMLVEYPLFITLCVGFLSALGALGVSIIFLEAERYFKNKVIFTGLYGSFFVPLLLPETVLLFGITFLAVYMSFNTNILTLSWVHFLYTFPYLMLTLHGSYHAYDERYSIIGRTLTKSNLRTFYKIKLPLLARTIAIALAVAFSVSVAQYLSTELIGGGKMSTITTQAVNLSAGLNRRIIGVYAILQMAIPLVAFLLVFYVFQPGDRSDNPTA